MAEFEFGLREDRLAAKVSLGGDVEQAEEVDAAALDHMILTLAQLRSQMLPRFPDKHDQSKAFTPVVYPAWFVDKDLMQNQPVVHIMHPGFGWQHFVIEPAVATELGNWLVKLGKEALEAPPPPNVKN